MKTKIFTLLLALAASVGTMFASVAIVDGMWYNINSDDLTAEVTYRGSSYDLYTNEYSDIVVIPPTIYFNGDTYNVTSIGENAFRGCYSLNSVTIPNSVTSIGRYAFYGCSGLTSVTIPNSVTSIGSSAFGNCSGLTSVTIPNRVTSIGSDAFSSCRSLTSVTIPNSVTSIGGGAFSGCSGLTSIEIPNSVTSIGDYTFSSCSGLTSVTIPNSVTSIGRSAFSGCRGLTSVTIPNSVTSIGENAFFGCSGLKSVTIPNSITNIGVGAFYGCSGLTSVTIPNSVTSIGVDAFRDCTGLTSVTIPNSVTSIGRYAFYGCTGLTSVTIPNSVTSIGDGAFGGCSGLSSVTLNSNFIVSKTYTSTSNMSEIFGENVSEYIIGDSVLNIGKHAFSGCGGLSSVVIGNSTTNIGDSAFYGCNDFSYLVIGNSITSIGKNAFKKCSINEIHYSGTLQEWCVKSWKANAISSNYKLFIEYEMTTDLVIPNSVTSIGSYAFSGCKSLTSVTIGNSVTSIGDHAFYGCSGLTSVTIGNSVTSIGSDAFSSCESLTSITIGNSVTSIEDNAFYDCSSLHSVTIPNSVTSIGYMAFYGCDNLVSVIFGNNVGYIGQHAFERCENIKSIEIPNSVTSIGEYAFQLCSSLTSVSIGNSIKKIGEYAFDGCSSLKTVVINAETPPTLDGNFGNWFDRRYLTSIYVPCGTSETYRTAAGWSNYASKIKEQSLPYTITTNALNGSISIDSICYDITLTVTSDEGYRFTQWSDGNKDNPRTFVLTQDTTFTAEFSNQFSINITCNEEYGTIVGENGMFDYLSEHTYEAVPNSGYHFTQWSDGNKDNPRTITLTQDTSLTAEFTNQYSINVSCNEEQGSINGENGMFDYQSVHTYEAIANSGYYFDQWSDGSKDNPRTIVLTQDTSLIAIFDTLYSVSVLSDDSTMGSASFSDLLETQSLNYGQYPMGTNLIAKAKPNQGYKFSHWSDGLSANPRGITVQSDINLKAYFELEQNSYTVTVSSANSSMGSVSGGGTYEEGTTATITATPKSGYKFTRWSNGSTVNPYSFTVTSNVSLTAYFEQIPAPQSESKFWNISDAVFNSLGTITSQTTINGLTIHATANKPIVVDADAREINGYSFTHRLKFGGTGASNARMLSFRVDGDCDIDIYLMSASGSADRTLNVDKGSFGSTLQQIPAYGSTISRGNVHYAGGATTIYLYSPSSGVNIYAIQVSYGSTPTPTEPIMVTCAEAAQIASSLSHNTQTSETYIVTGYITETDGVVSRGQQVFWMADTQNGGNVFESYWGNVSEEMLVGDKVSVEGKIMRYNSTYEIKNGDVTLIERDSPAQSFTVTVSSANSSMGTVSGGGTYEEGQIATVTATPKSGYKFTRWSNGSTANPYSFTVTSDVSLTAYFEQIPAPQSESKFWNISDAVFNSLGTITSQTTINGLTIHATANKPIVVDADAREINGYSFTHRLKFGGTGVNDARMLSFKVDGDCDIDIYLMSASGSADRTLNVDKGSFGNTIQQIPAYGSTISEGNVHYAGGATTIYLYSPSSGVNIYAIRVTYGGKEEGIDDLYVQPQEEASKILHNGQIFILRGDKTYTLQGQEVE